MEAEDAQLTKPFSPISSSLLPNKGQSAAWMPLPPAGLSPVYLMAVIAESRNLGGGGRRGGDAEIP